MKRKLIIILIIGALVLTGLSTSSIAQIIKKEADVNSTSGAINCIVYDGRSGIFLSSASLTLQSKDKTIRRFGVTNPAGEHTFIGVPSNHEYEITANKRFFTTNTVDANIGDTVYIVLGYSGSKNIKTSEDSKVLGKNDPFDLVHIKVHVIDEDGNDIPSALVCVWQCNDLAPPSIVDSDLTSLKGQTRWLVFFPSWCGNWIVVNKKGYDKKEYWGLSGDGQEVEITLIKSGGGGGSKNIKTSENSKLLGNNDLFGFVHVKFHVVDEDGNDIPSALVRVYQNIDYFMSTLIRSDLTNLLGQTRWLVFQPSWLGNWVEVTKEGYDFRRSKISEDGGVIEITLNKNGDDSSRNSNNNCFESLDIPRLLENFPSLFDFLRAMIQTKNLINNVEV